MIRGNTTLKPENIAEPDPCAGIQPPGQRLIGRSGRGREKERGSVPPDQRLAMF